MVLVVIQLRIDILKRASLAVDKTAPINKR